MPYLGNLLGCYQYIKQSNPSMHKSFKSELDDLYCDQVHLNKKGNAELGQV